MGEGGVMDLQLRGKVALVAGSSRGLGRAIAEELAAEGASLALCARSEAALAEARASIADRSGVRVSAVAADLSRGEEARRVVESATAEHGRTDILVTNTGGPPPGPFERHDPGAWQAAAQLLLMSAVELTRAALPGMKARRFGRILNVTSIAVKQPVDNLILSNALRAAVTGMARTLANEVARDGITVNNLMPGYTRTQRVEELAQATARTEGTAPAAVVARWEAQIPMGRLGEPRELAALAAFLASERAGYITGQSIAVDGGWIRSVL
jgi:3-oxoacyl-[acyl-carrier protein] reductase